MPNLSVVDFIDTLLNRQRKLLVAGCGGLVLVGGFAVVAYKPAALEAYKILAEWTVWLVAAFAGGNALTYFANRPGKPNKGA